MNASFGTTMTVAVACLVAALVVSPVRAQQKSSEWRDPFLSATEQAEHDKKMQSFKTYQECAAYMAEHRKKIEALAKAQGRSLRNIKLDECDNMRRQGLIK